MKHKKHLLISSIFLMIISFSFLSGCNSNETEYDKVINNFRKDSVVVFKIIDDTKITNVKDFTPNQKEKINQYIKNYKKNQDLGLDHGVIAVYMEKLYENTIEYKKNKTQENENYYSFFREKIINSFDELNIKY